MGAFAYVGTVNRVIDGDSVVFDLDLGFKISLEMNVRLNGINARELSMPGGKEARDNLRSLLPPGTRATVLSLGWDKYGGRADGIVTLPTGDLAEMLVSQNWAALWDGKGPAPLPPWPRPE